jgi:hypothetical protein
MVNQLLRKDIDFLEELIEPLAPYHRLETDRENTVGSAFASPHRQGDSSRLARKSYTRTMPLRSSARRLARSSTAAN